MFLKLETWLEKWLYIYRLHQLAMLFNMWKAVKNEPVDN